MLIGLDPLLNADLIYALAQMGHGDEIIIADTNFPSVSCAQPTNFGRPILLTGASAPQAVRAILSIMQLDDFVPCAAFRMEVVDDPAAMPDVQKEVAAELAARHPDAPFGTVERHDFYVRARKAFAIVRTGETRPYGCFVFKKGIVRPGE